MLRFATVLAAVLLTGFQAASPTLPPRLAVLAEDPQAARTFDYFSLRPWAKRLANGCDSASGLMPTGPGAAA